MKLFVSFIIFFGTLCGVFGQSISGTVLDDDTGEPIPNVVVVNTLGNEWSLSDDSGNFLIVLHSNVFELEFKMLGKESKVVSNDQIVDQDNLIVRLKDYNLRLEEVTVTAIPKRAKIGSAIVLDAYAVNQVQSYSLSDVLSQLPGQRIGSPSLNSANTLSLRTAFPNATNAFGVAYELDGTRLSNDENMQTYISGANFTEFENVNTGIDLRTIPAENIEKVEVISGIPDAEYGNLTSGLIKIDRKAGITPFRVNANINQGNTSVSVGKGVHLNDRWGDLSLSVDFLNANSDPRNSLTNYNRLTASAIWSTYSKSKSIKNTLSLTLHNNLDDTNYDKDNDDGGRDAQFRKDRGVKISNRFNWKPAANWIDNFNINVGFSYAYQHSYRQSFINDGGKVVPVNLETGLSNGEYTPVAYLMIQETYGQPINFNSKISLDKSLGNDNSVLHNIAAGLNFSFSDNRGRGRAYNPENAHTQVTLRAGGSSLSTGEGIRPLDYGRYVKPRIGVGAYVQDNMTWRWENGRALYSNIGFRYDIQNGFSSYGPRINMGVELLNNFSIRGGLGFASKAPSLAQIFPGDKYFDVLIRDFRTSRYSFNLVQTYKKEIEKQNISPSKSWKYELGANFNPDFGNFALTAYYNHTFDGVASYELREKVAIPEIEFIFNDPAPPSYNIVGQSPFILDYSLSANNLDYIDKGVELYFNSDKIKAINTSFSLMGSYVYSKSTNETELIEPNDDPLEEEYLYGVYVRKPIKLDKLNLRATITHHIPELGLLISLSAEQFTFSTSYASVEAIYPVAYINPDLERIAIPVSERSDNRYSGLWRSPNASKDIRTPTYHNFHARVTKEFLNGVSMSMYVTNFLDYRPIVVINESEKRTNSPISFGANIQYQF